MMTRLLVGMLTPAIRAIRSCSICAMLTRVAKHRGTDRRGVRWRPALAENPKRKKSHALDMAPGPRTRSGWRRCKRFVAVVKQKPQPALSLGDCLIGGCAHERENRHPLRDIEAACAGKSSRRRSRK